MPEEYRQYLDDIIEAGSRIQEYTNGMSSLTTSLNSRNFKLGARHFSMPTKRKAAPESRLDVTITYSCISCCEVQSHFLMLYPSYQSRL